MSVPSFDAGEVARILRDEHGLVADLDRTIEPDCNASLAEVVVRLDGGVLLIGPAFFPTANPAAPATGNACSFYVCPDADEDRMVFINTESPMNEHEIATTVVSQMKRGF